MCCNYLYVVRYMKRYRLLIFILALILIVCLNSKAAYSYFTSADTTDTQTVVLGNLKIETDNTPENSWRYVPIAVEGSNFTENDAINIKNLSGSLDADNLRPGDAFEKDITITNTGSLSSKLKIAEGVSLKDSPFKIRINMKSNDSGAAVSNESGKSDTWYVYNLKPNAKVVFTVRLELPADITNKDLNENNIKLSSNALELLDITAAQWNNSSWSE